MTSGGDAVAIEDVVAISAPGTHVYNISVDRKTYFVTNAGFLVHNK